MTSTQTQLLQHVIDGNSLSTEQAQSFFTQVVNNEVSEPMLGAMLTALKIKGEEPEEIAGAVLASKQNAKQFPTLDFDVSECVGTGGDGHNTINISTTSAIVAAACGIKVAKHGGRSVSSLSGAADLLEKMGAKLDMSPETAANCLDKANFCFLFAPHYHAGFRYAAPVRKAMGVRTLFNILGPMVNPSNPSTILLGVYDPSLMETVAKTLMLTGIKKGWVVHGSGLDEIALHGQTDVLEISENTLTRKVISPKDFGLSEYPITDIAGGSPEENANIIKSILKGEGSEAHNAAITINCAALLYLNGKHDSLLDAADEVKQVLRSGKPMSVIEDFVTLSQQGDD